MLNVAARAARRVAERADLIQSRYIDIQNVITREEQQREFETYGHEYDEDCQSPFCVKVRRIYEAALQQALQQGAPNG